MSEEESIFRNLRGLANDWVDAKRRTLNGTPLSNVDKSSRSMGYQFEAQDYGEDELREIKAVREAGGIVSQLMHAKALMNFGTDIHFEDPDGQVQVINGEPVTLEDYFHDVFGDLDLLALELGEDAIWYPYAAAEIVENQVGGFSKILPIEPWTLEPETDEQGRIVRWTQTTYGDEGRVEQILDPDDIAHFVLNKSSARDEVGISEVLRNMEEINAWKNNQRAVNQAIELHGFPQRHVKVGREGGAPIRDDELRRVRTIFDPATTDANTAYFTGQDVNIDTLEAHSFDFAAIQEMSLTALTAAIGMPLEAANMGSDGLGSGMPAQIRMSILKLQINANQRSFSRQILDNIIRPVIRDYTPFDHNGHFHLEFGEPIDDVEERSKLVRQAGSYMTTNEAREKLDLPPRDDLKDQYGPAVSEEPQDTEEEPMDEEEVIDLFFEDGSELVNFSPVEYEMAADWDKPLLEAHAKIFHRDAGDKILGFTSGSTPDFIKSRIRDSVFSGAIFNSFDSIPSARREEFKQSFADTLTSDEWTIDDVTDMVTSFDPSLDRNEAEAIARTETASIVNTAREEGYQEMGQGGDRFYWTGVLDDRTTDACEWLINETNPNKGGTPVSMAELKELIEEAPTHDEQMEDGLARPDDFVVHPNERKTFVRYVDA